MNEKPNPSPEDGNKKNFIGKSREPGWYWEDYKDRSPVYFWTALKTFPIPDKRDEKIDFLLNLYHRHFGNSVTPVASYREFDATREEELQQQIRALPDEELEAGIHQQLNELEKMAPLPRLTRW
jgi:hypothetical protein